MTSRRKLLIASVAAMVGGWHLWRSSAAGTEGTFEVMMSEDAWRKVLTKDQFHVLRKHGTERPFSHPLNDNTLAGTYHCAGCELTLYSSEAKYDSRTGWPSFWQALDDSVGTSTDYFLGYARTEVHCRRCGGHLGHIFGDGPPPTGKRHCINGVSLKFIAT
jgi:peptide-methionine (R)-S-oxide reductase